MSVRSSCRADLAGGTLDIWPLGVMHPGARTVNLALTTSVRVEMRRRRRGYRVVQGGSEVVVASPDEWREDRGTALIGLAVETLGLPPVDIVIESESPRGAGLGASSALTVGLIAAGQELVGAQRSAPGPCAELARDLEARLMQLPTGCQDHYPALLGGVLELRYEPGGTVVRRLDVDLEKLSSSLIVAYTGATHVSAENNWHVVRSRLNGEAASITLFDGICDVARRLAESIVEGDLEAVGRLMSEEWGLRRQLSEVISIPIIERLLSVADTAGAWGGKACGAGGGGCVAVLAPPAVRAELETALVEAGASLLPTACAAEGLSVEVA